MRTLVAIVMIAALSILQDSLATEPTIDGIQIQIGHGPPDFSQLPLTRPLVSKLKAGETVDIRATTQHCFGGYTYALRLSGPPPLSVVVRGRHDAAVDGQLPFLGQTILTRADAVRVDRVLAYYRTRPEGACTSSTTVSVDWKLRSGTKSEFWFDDSCAVVDSEFALSLYSVAQRAAAKTP